jgi:hypothetical protein
MSVSVAKTEEIKEYYQSEALGQSKLKRLLGDLSNFNKEEDSTKEHFVIGSAVDCILTGEEGEFNAQYYVSDIEKKPSDSIIEILDKVYNYLQADYQEYIEVTSGVVETEDGELHTISSFDEFAGDLETWEHYILEATEITGWQPKWGNEAKLKNILGPGSEYFKDLCKAYGKQVLDKARKQTIDSIVHSLRTNQRTERFFDRTSWELNPLVTVHYQFPIYFEHKGVDCKALLDMVFVERTSEGRITAITGIDLKTMNGNTLNFHYSLKQRRYDIQAAWYTLALSKYFALDLDSDILKPFMFVVESTTSIGKPLVFELAKEVMELGRIGRKAVKLVDTNLFNQDAFPQATLMESMMGYEDLLKIYIYHNHNGWREEEIVQRAGLFPLLLTLEGTELKGESYFQSFIK